MKNASASAHGRDRTEQKPLEPFKGDFTECELGGH